jgi:TPR repeat protein
VTTNMKPGLSGPVQKRDGSFQSSRAFIRQYDWWIKRLQDVSGPDFMSRAHQLTVGAMVFEPFAVNLALAMQRKRDQTLRRQGERGLSELADAGINLARYNLALIRKSTPSLHSSVFELMSSVADTEKGDPYLKGLAIAGTGECYLFALGVERDVAKAHELFEQAAEYAVAEAAFNVGLYHDDKKYDPYRGPVDFEKAARYYRRGADLGHVSSMTHLGMLFVAHHLGAEKAAVGWELLERASAAGDSVAKDALSVIGSIEALRTSAPPVGLSSVLFTRV